MPHYPAPKIPTFLGFSPKIPRSRGPIIPSCLIIPRHKIPTLPGLFSQIPRSRGSPSTSLSCHKIPTFPGLFSQNSKAKGRARKKKKKPANSTREVRAGFGMKNFKKNPKQTGSSQKYLLQAFKKNQKQTLWSSRNCFPTKNSQLDDGERSFLCPGKAVAREGSVPSVAMGMIFPGNAAGGGEETPEIH